jgi:heat shock protein HslJ
VKVKNIQQFWKYSWLILVALAVPVAACTQTTSPSDDEVTSSENPLVGTDWDLVQYGEQTPLPGATASITFTEDEINGSTGCNSYFGNYTLDVSALAIDPLGRTERGCEGIMEQEEGYLEMLQASESITLEEERLTIHTALGDIVFKPKEDLTLEGTNWVLSSIVQDQDVVSTRRNAEEITAVFEEGQVAGSTGCNQYFTDYQLDGTDLTLGTVSATTMSCDEETDQREQEYLTALAEVAGFEIERETLTLTDTEGNHLVIFRAQSENE